MMEMAARARTSTGNHYSAVERALYSCLPALKRQRVLVGGTDSVQLAFSLKSRHKALSIVVVDKSRAQLLKALDLANRKGLPMRFMEGPCDQLPFSNEAFDIVVSGKPLTTRSNVKGIQALNEYYRVLRKSGHVVVIAKAAKHNFSFTMEGAGFENVTESRNGLLHVFSGTKIKPEQMLSQPG